jgi:hypothetical protein
MRTNKEKYREEEEEDVEKEEEDKEIEEESKIKKKRDGKNREGKSGPASRSADQLNNLLTLMLLTTVYRFS